MHPFQLMSEPIRRRIVTILASGEHTAGEISDAIQNEFGVTQSAVSRHLRILRENNAVIVRAEWVNRLYRLDESLFERLKDEVYYFDELWQRRIGVMAGNVEPVVTWPIQPRVRPRAREGTKRGLRGTGARDDPWQRDQPRA